ncbi:MAG TPA: NAD(P)-binding domain-containing protein, partial [Paludibacteraceae bacterium]|nr:NAD(P)-binding domain-containing protein [Paludibacteraceae bacterium]
MNVKGKIAVIGGGSWATAIAKIVLTNEDTINWYMRRQEQIDEFIRLSKNPSYLTGVKFDTERINFTNDINKVVRSSDLLIFATPSPFLKQHLKKLRVKLNKKFIVSAIKGIVPDENLTVTEYFQQFYGILPENLAVLAGPCHAEEIALERLSYLTIACTSREKARILANRLATNFVKTSISD